MKCSISIFIKCICWQTIIIAFGQCSLSFHREHREHRLVESLVLSVIMCTWCVHWPFARCLIAKWTVACNMKRTRTKCRTKHLWNFLISLYPHQCVQVIKMGSEKSTNTSNIFETGEKKKQMKWTIAVVACNRFAMHFFCKLACLYVAGYLNNKSSK